MFAGYKIIFFHDFEGNGRIGSGIVAPAPGVGNLHRFELVYAFQFHRLGEFRHGFTSYIAAQVYEAFTASQEQVQIAVAIHISQVWPRQKSYRLT